MAKTSVVVVSVVWMRMTLAGHVAQQPLDAPKYECVQSSSSPAGRLNSQHQGLLGVKSPNRTWFGESFTACTRCCWTLHRVPSPPCSHPGGLGEFSHYFYSVSYCVRHRQRRDSLLCGWPVWSQQWEYIPVVDVQCPSREILVRSGNDHWQSTEIVDGHRPSSTGLRVVLHRWFHEGSHEVSHQISFSSLQGQGIIGDLHAGAP